MLHTHTITYTTRLITDHLPSPLPPSVRRTIGRPDELAQIESLLESQGR